MKRLLLITAALMVSLSANAQVIGGGTISPSGGGTGTSTVFTQGSIVFAGASGVYSQDNANFNWNDSTSLLTVVGNTTIGSSAVSAGGSKLLVSAATGNTGEMEVLSGQSPIAGAFIGQSTGGTFVISSNVNTNGVIQTVGFPQWRLKVSGSDSFDIERSPAGSTYTPVEALHITNTGTIGLGTATPRNSSKLDVNGGLNVSGAPFLTGLTTGTNADFLCLGATGQIFLQASSCTISKRAFKENIHELDDSALDEVMQFRPVQFNMKKQLANGKLVTNPDKNFIHTQLGFIAEDVAEIDPRVTTYEQDDKTPKSWDERKFVALLTKAVQVQQHEIDAINHKNRFGRFMDWLEGVR